MNRDGWSGVMLLALDAAYYWASRAIPDSTLSDEVGATGLPHLLTLALAGLGIILLVRSLLILQPAKAAEADAREADQVSASLPRAVGFLMLGVGYVVIVHYVGYMIGVALLIAAVALYEGAARRWTIPVAAIGGALLYWALFVKLLGVNQPVGTIFHGLFS
jgi:putative tricarboxylic transport membrane protein